MTRESLPHIPFEKIVGEILPERYQLSVVICGDTLAKKINRVYRKKNYPPNVLSFPLGAYEGEIFLNIRAAKREAKRLRVSLRARLILLFIHSCLHLNGMRHGREMERLEEKILERLA